MIVLEDSLFHRLDGSIKGLRHAVQAAIELEHATIPPYLYALYSIKPGKNVEVGQIIRSVVREEMLHMTIACNLLNAIGGTPEIDSPGFLPKYPGPLPHSVQSGLVVTLAPVSIAQVKNVFAKIEEPEIPLDFPDIVLPPTTIGKFYRKISDTLKSGDFTGHPKQQVTAAWWPSDQLFPITDLVSARSAIEIIVEQGEGTTTSPTDQSLEFAHYYRFEEIVHKHRLIKNPHAGPSTPPNKRYIYRGARVPLDRKGVQPLIVNPAVKGYPSGSAAAVANDAFNATYTALLHCLQSVFTVNPQQLATSIGIMESLKDQALAMSQIPLGTNLYAGPTFEYRKFN